jgi:hypothetical protein
MSRDGWEETWVLTREEQRLVDAFRKFSPRLRQVVLVGMEEGTGKLASDYREDIHAT